MAVVTELTSMRRGAATANLLAVLVVLCCAGCAGVANSAVARTEPLRAPAKARTRPRTRSAQQDLTAALAPLAQRDGGHFAVAVDDLTTGRQAGYGGTREFATASIAKVDILVTLLYQAQEAGQPLTDEEQDLATTMIENSNNDSASDLYADVGGPDAVDDANQACGLSETAAGTDGLWGLTTTTVDDQIRLLRVVFTRPSPLSAASQQYVQGLMSQVEADQQWGVPAAADPGTSFMVKNGWLPNPTRWEINSIGEITRDGQRLLIAVLSDDNASEDSGISVVQAAAKATASAMVSAPAGS
jgi:Beta-lactamase enzyme family